MSAYQEACKRYKTHRKHARELVEEDLLHAFGRRIHVLAIDDDILRRARQDWYGHENRRYSWDWDAGIVAPFWANGIKGFDLALTVDGQLCGLAVARMSPRKNWLSLTHIEGSPKEHPLKRQVLPIVVSAMYTYRAVVCDEQACKQTGIRILNPLDEALPCYRSAGYTEHYRSKRLHYIVVEQPKGEEDESATEDSQCKEAKDGADCNVAT